MVGIHRLFCVVHDSFHMAHVDTYRQDDTSLRNATGENRLNLRNPLHHLPNRRIHRLHSNFLIFYIQKKFHRKPDGIFSYRFNYALTKSARECFVGLMHCSCTLCEEFLLLFVEVDFDDLLDATLAKNARNADAKIFLAIFAVKKC